jgi:Protein of unknown function (DUF2971)
MSQLTPEQLTIVEKLNGILFPHARRKRDAMLARKGRFVHYTSAEAGLNIIKSRCIWMRNTTCMSDYREVHHGYEALQRYFANEANRQSFNSVLNECHADIAEEAVNSFDRTLQSTQIATYITSISEHDDREDTHGRLSMWRAFGNSTARVAIVIKLDLEIGKNIALGAELSPVAYFTDDELAHELNAVIANINVEREYLRRVDRAWFLATVHTMLTSAIVCLKHEGFDEEREWRVIHAPSRQPAEHILSSFEVVAGVPQRVYKLAFRSDAEAGLTGLNPNELIDRVIIGPTQYPFAMYDAFVTALTDAGLPDAADRVVVSKIPVRT